MESLRTFGWAWMGLTASFGLHVVDEAVNDFLGYWNPAIEAYRESIPWLPLPVFSFGVWLGLLLSAVAALAAATPAMVWSAEKGGKRARFWLRFVSYPYGFIMFGNGIFHLTWSWQMGKAMPGAYSAPLLLAASVWLLREVWQVRESE